MSTFQPVPPVFGPPAYLPDQRLPHILSDGWQSITSSGFVASSPLGFIDHKWRSVTTPPNSSTHPTIHLRGDPQFPIDSLPIQRSTSGASLTSSDRGSTSERTLVGDRSMEKEEIKLDRFVCSVQSSPFPCAQVIMPLRERARLTIGPRIYSSMAAMSPFARIHRTYPTDPSIPEIRL